MKRPSKPNRAPAGTTKTGKPDGPYLSYEEVAEKLGGITVATLKRRIREAGLQPVRPGRTPYLHETDVPKLLEATRQRTQHRAARPLLIRRHNGQKSAMSGT